MPVRLPDADQDFIGPYNRLSASQVNTWKACPRLWFYEKVRRFVMPQIPILFVGRAVEEAICKTLKESPALIVEAAPAEIYAETPLDANGRPDREYEQRWPAEQLLALPESSGQRTSIRSNIGRINVFALTLPSVWRTCVSSGSNTIEKQEIGMRMSMLNDVPKWR